MEQTTLIQHTKHIFEQLCQAIPPLVPEELQVDLSNALEQVQDTDLTIEELEQTIIVFGKKLWPYRQAFLEFFRVNEGTMGERFLLSKLPRETKKKYNVFTAGGGSFHDLHRGGEVVQLFTPEERAILCEAFVDVEHEIWDFTKQQVLTEYRKQYQQKISEFQSILSDIEYQLRDLLLMADKEQEHPTLAAEIREHVRGFEHGLAILGPPLDYEQLCNAPEYFQGRKAYKTLQRHPA